MPYSFTQIEQDKSKVIGFVFAFLIGFYFISALVVYLAAKISIALDNSQYGTVESLTLLTPVEAVTIICVAFVAGVIHWSVSTHNLIPKLLSTVGAEALNPKDTFHRMLQNIIDEVSVATGGRRIEGVVIPTMAMNAFALSDFSGRAVIGVTEGLLARLNRAQIEAVVGHEAAHIVTGDCLTTTVTSSLFKLYGSVLSGMNKMVGEGRGVRVRSRGSGTFVLIYFVLMLINFFGTLVNMFISRQREFRADAIAVRLTRDPLSLAEALYSISSRWRGASLSGEELEAIFILNPRFNALDEGQSFFSGLFSTHPPVSARISILLEMAHSNLDTLEKDVERKSQRPRQPAPEDLPAPGAGSKEWLIHHNGQWVGPIDLTQLLTTGWLQPDTWVKKMGAKNISQAGENEDIRHHFQKGRAESGLGLCPRCGVLLAPFSYEGAQVFKCPECYGVLASQSDVSRVLIRRDYEFSDRIKKIAAITKNERFKPILKKLDVGAENFVSCPHCRQAGIKMIRSFFSVAYCVEVDRCAYCGSVWFDKDELEVLQFLVEQGTDTDNGSE